MNPIIVKGHVTTWKITPTEDGQYRVTPGGKNYKDVPTAKWAIRTAEDRYVKDHPMAPVANRDVWFDHGMLIVDDWDGNYYESKAKVEEDPVVEANTTGRYVWCEYQYVAGDTAEQLMRFAQMAYNNRYYTDVKVTGFTKQEYNHAEGHQVLRMTAEGLHEEYDSFYFLIQCTEDEAKEIPEGSVTEAFNADKVQKRIARADEFDNGKVIHNDYFDATSDEAEERAKQMSLDNPGKTFYVKYDDVMNPSSDKKWKDGKVVEAKDDDDMHPHGYDDVIKLIKNGKLWNHREIELDTGDCDKLETYLRQHGHEVNYNEEDDEYYADVGQLGRISFSDRHLYTEAKGNICPSCGQELGEDGHCYNSECKDYDPISQYFDTMNNPPLEDVGGPARYQIDYFKWEHERCYLTGYDGDADKDIEIELCNGVGDEESGRKKALEILQDKENYNVPVEVRNELISTFGLDDFGLKIEESMKDYRFQVSCNDGPTDIVRLVWDANDPEGAQEMAKKYYSNDHTTNADDRENKWTIEESEDLYRHKTNQHTGSWDNDPDDITLNQPDNEEYGMTITIGSGVNADGCSIRVLDKNGNTVHDEEYRYGYNASYSRKWASFYPDKPFIGDIVNDLCKKYSINRGDIDYRKGKNLFKDTDATDDQVSEFIKMLDESKKIETDADKLANNVEVTNEPQDDQTLADKIESETHQPDLFVGKKCIFTYKGLIDDITCNGFDDNEQKLKDASGKEVEVISGCDEYGYAIKVDGKELYGVSGEELVVHEDSSRVEEVPSDK